jgi:hypothetical protein
MPDGWEVQYQLNPLSIADEHGINGDPDNDGLTNGQEWDAQTNPRNPDTDGDGMPDGWEVRYQLDPLSTVGEHGALGDPDNDGFTNAEEYANGTNPRQADSRPTNEPFRLHLPLIVR